MQPAELLFDVDTQEFLKALGQSTANLYRVGLKSFQEFYGASPKVFIDRVEEDLHAPRGDRKRVARNTVREFIVWLQKKGYAPKTVRAYVASLQSMSSYYDVVFTTKYTNLPTGLPVSKKEPWTLVRISAFIEALKMPHRAVAAVILQSGLGLGDVLALCYGDIRQELEAEVTPLCLDLTRIKTDVPFMTFVGKWGVWLLKQHLEGAVLSDKDKLFMISKRAIESHFKRVAAGFVGDYTGFNPARPHSLRAAFKTLLSDHRVDPLFTEFWMGHRVAEQQRVYVSKSREGWRLTYRDQAEAWLTPASFVKQRERAQKAKEG